METKRLAHEILTDSTGVGHSPALTGGSDDSLRAPWTRSCVTHCPDTILVLHQWFEPRKLMMSSIATVREGGEGREGRGKRGEGRGERGEGRGKKGEGRGERE